MGSPTECHKCYIQNLNKRYLKGDGYKELKKDEIDYSTFNSKLANVEIVNIKNNIKDLFRFKHIYNYIDIYSNIVNSLSNENMQGLRTHPEFRYEKTPPFNHAHSDR